MTRRTLLQSIAAFFAGLFGARGATISGTVETSGASCILADRHRFFVMGRHGRVTDVYSNGRMLDVPEVNRLGRILAKQHNCHWTDITEA